MDVDIPASLFLSTTQIETDASIANVANTVGSWTNNRQSFSFNVKLRQLLGNAYETYDTFVISLVNYSVYNPVSTTNPLFMEVQMGGLSWVNSSYDQSTFANSFWAPLCVVNQPAAALSLSVAPFDILSNTLVFRKGDPDLSIQFRVLNATTRTLMVPTSGYLPTFNFSFKIQPVKK